MISGNIESENSELIIDQLISFEEDNFEEFMNYKLCGYHLWPIIRTHVLHIRLLTQLSNTKNTFVADFKTGRNKRRLISTFFKGLVFHNPISFGAKKYVFFSPDSLRRYVGGMYTNVIYDYLASELGYDNIHYIEESILFEHRTPAPEAINLKYFEVFGLAAAVLRRKYTGLPTIKHFENLIVEKANNRWGDKINIKPDFEYDISFSLAYASILKRFIPIWKPSAVFMHLACYGLAQGLICKMCKEYGIPVIEYQHGHVTRHPAYTYADNIGEYSSYLPDYFFTYGNYWVEKLGKLPCVKYAIGYPYLSEYIKSKKVSNAEKKAGCRDILFITDRLHTKDIIGIAEELARLMPDCRIYVRPHPMERLNFSSHGCFQNTPNIAPSKNDDLYEDMYNTDIVVGYYSIVLFEACAFSKPIFVWDGPSSRICIPQGLGCRFDTAVDLAEKIKSGCGKTGGYGDELFARDWDSNFKQAMDEILSKQR